MLNFERPRGQTFRPRQFPPNRFNQHIPVYNLPEFLEIPQPIFFRIAQVTLYIGLATFNKIIYVIYSLISLGIRCTKDPLKVVWGIYIRNNRIYLVS